MAGEDSCSIPCSSSMLEEKGIEVGGEEGAHPARRKRKKSTIHLSTFRRVITIPENIYLVKISSVTC